MSDIQRKKKEFFVMKGFSSADAKLLAGFDSFNDYLLGDQYVTKHFQTESAFFEWYWIESLMRDVTVGVLEVVGNDAATKEEKIKTLQERFVPNLSVLSSELLKGLI